MQKSTRPTPNTSQYTKKRTIKQQQNARPGGDTEDKTFGKPFPNGRFYLLVFEINYLRAVDINGEVSVLFLCYYSRAVEIVGGNLVLVGFSRAVTLVVIGAIYVFITYKSFL